MAYFDYKRRMTSLVNIGGVPLGADNPIRVQSMTSTSTDDIEASVAQCQRIADAGADYVRLTAQGVKEALNIGRIRELLRANGYNTPLVADIHFNPKAAFAAAEVTDKVRINPGNFVDAARVFKKLSFTDEEYAEEIKKIERALIPFIEVCRQNGTAVRIGVNHGSLSDRIMSRYGDTPAGMVESAMEFLRVFVAQKFFDVVISIKASNTVIMVETVRRLVRAMDSEDMHFPLHLGVTEAGDGEDGRIKSAVGIGTLLSEGIGDTIRVSLSEDPELEVPVAQMLLRHINLKRDAAPIEGSPYDGYDAVQPHRRHTTEVAGIVGGSRLPIVIAHCAPGELDEAMNPDFFFLNQPLGIDDEHRFIIPAEYYDGRANVAPAFTDIDELLASSAPMKWLIVDAAEPVEAIMPLAGRSDSAIILTTTSLNASGALQAAIHRFTSAGISLPVVPMCHYNGDAEHLQVEAAADMGTLLLNGLRDGIFIDAPFVAPNQVVRYAFAILQAARLRISKTEFISCPSCGRTMFDLQTTVKAVKAATSHLSHLKIGIMGCIVNGPGEMADADYGYVGAAAGKISLYKGKECIEKNIPQEEAIPRLIALIKRNGDWREP
ncbi:MAG: (E)-4-hydroxy-3-methylbut-2-enyl-diphosphate synthase [Muribaculaceae bacterium]